EDHCAISDLVVFGDSYSDNGNLWRATNKIFPSPKYYFQGRWSNGRVWIEDLSCMLRASLTDLAYAGALTNNSIYENEYPFTTNNISDFIIPSVDEQVQSFSPYVSCYPPKTTYVFWSGINDCTKKVVSSIENYISYLASKGAKKFLVINVPAVDKSPDYNKFDNRTKLQDTIKKFNNLLNATMSKLDRSNRNINIKVFDSYGFFKRIIEQPQIFGFKNVVDPCVNATNDMGRRGLKDVRNHLLEKRHHAGGKCKVGNHENDGDNNCVTKEELSFHSPGACENPNEYFWWDGLHPSEKVHKLIASRVKEFICNLKEWKC
ncbi:13549_t:CDS:2, partial [Acaulospora morrowiae]